MKLKDLLETLPTIKIYGCETVEIKGISANSKQIEKGFLFIAKKGLAFDGQAFLQEAIDKGAVAVLTNQFDPNLKNCVQIVHPSVALIEGVIAAIFFNFPSKQLLTIGITGTNGKTTTSLILKNLIEQMMGSCGLIGTIYYSTGASTYPATRTTPDVIYNQKLMQEMVEHACQACVMEVTSHALVQQRVAFIDFDIAIFTNLTQDHLDYHQTMQNYAEAKSQLFKRLNVNQFAIVNADSIWSSLMIENCQAQVFTYGIDQEADLKVTHISFSKGKTTLYLKYLGEIMMCTTPFVGRFNVYNCLAAMSALLTQGHSLSTICQYLENVSPVKGRLEPVPNSLNLNIFVDFAHTEDALKNVLETLHEFKHKGRIFVVFGCGGDRDRTKRPKMAKICQKLADFTIVTADNPRSENALDICLEICQGFDDQECYTIEINRELAIAKAINRATQDDLILIAGKGHELTQTFATQTIAFDDADVAATYCLKIASVKMNSFVEKQCLI